MAAGWFCFKLLCQLGLPLLVSWAQFCSAWAHLAEVAAATWGKEFFLAMTEAQEGSTYPTGTSQTFALCSLSSQWANQVLRPSPRSRREVHSTSPPTMRPGREGMGMGIGHLLGSEEVGLRTQSAISRDQPPGLRLSCQVQKYLPSLSKEDVIDMSEHMFSRHPE